MRPEVVRDEMQPLLERVDCAKDVKLVHFWPVIAEAFPEAKWVIVWRDPKKIAASCMRTHFMKALTSLELPQALQGAPGCVSEPCVHSECL